jgi:1-deoxy-D-xylulose-5-phosphate synthase
MVIMAPRDTTELAEMVRFAMDYDKGPLAVRYPRGSADDSLPEARTPIQFARAETLRTGSDVGLIGFGSMTSLMNRAADSLAEDGISAEVLNARFAKPLDDEAILALARKTRRLVVAEENVLPGGFGEAVRRLLYDNGLQDVKISLHALPDRFIEHGSQSDLLREAGLTVSNFVAAAKSLVGANK